MERLFYRALGMAQGAIGRTMFTLHPRLAADTLEIADLPLCKVLLMKDARYPWLILVPRRDGLREIHQLKVRARSELMEEIAQCSQIIESLFAPDKINVGALGNLVPQLHIHVIGRRTDDAAWPGPVWGVGETEPYDRNKLKTTRSLLMSALGDR